MPGLLGDNLDSLLQDLCPSSGDVNTSSVRSKRDSSGQTETGTTSGYDTDPAFDVEQLGDVEGVTGRGAGEGVGAHFLGMNWD